MNDLERERALRGWTADEAARRAGISPKTWQRIEDGKPSRVITAAKVERLFADNPVTRTVPNTEMVELLGVAPIVRAVPSLSLEDLKRLRDVVDTAIAIRSEVGR